MFARLSRTTFASAARCSHTSVPLSVARVSRRTMSATSHASTKSSDTPWMVFTTSTRLIANLIYFSVRLDHYLSLAQLCVVLFLVLFATITQCQLELLWPQLLYLLSPSARKNTHGAHNDHHALKQHEEHQAPKSESPAVEILKDDEGTEANVTSSIALAQVRIYACISYPRPSIK